MAGRLISGRARVLFLLILFAALTVVLAGGQAFAQLLAPAIMIYMGWEYAFFIFGGFVLLFCWSWKVWAYNTPEDDPRCSPEEKALIAEGKGESDDSTSS